MPIQPWIATCIQTLNHVVNDVSTREDARVIMHRSLDRCLRATSRGRLVPS